MLLCFTFGTTLCDHNSVECTDAHELETASLNKVFLETWRIYFKVLEINVSKSAV